MPKVSHPNDGIAEELAEFLDENARLTCRHCGQTAKPHLLYGAEAWCGDPLATFTSGRPERNSRYKLSVAVCASCTRESLFIRKWSHDESEFGDPQPITAWHRQVYPIGRATKHFPETPEEHSRAYREACAVLQLSPAASACMSRRCLQGILREQGYDQRDLAEQITQLLAEEDSTKALPPNVRVAVDAIRNFGNFGAHPISDVTTLQIIAVEEGEADWCIELSEELMDHYYERPAKMKERIARTNAKLKAGGKPPLKS